MNRRSVFYVLMSLMPLFLVCEKEMVSVKRTNVTLRAEYVGVTEAWLKLQTHEANCGVQIKRGNKVIFRSAEIKKDTVVYDSTLSPAHTYNYALFLQDGRGEWHKAQEMQITTMDTTSHDFQWEVVEFPSPYGSGVLYDVAIINENDIWAVGEIYSDSSQPWLPYNAVHWDGSKWELRRIYKENNNAIQTIRGLLTFDGKNFWFAAGSIYKWNINENYARLVYRRDINTFQTVEKLWGISEINIYGVGNEGLIVHYNSRGWRQIYSGTELPITDIWGIADLKTGDTFILCTAAEIFSGKHSKIIQINSDNSVSQFPWPYYDRDSYSVWFHDSFNIFVCGDGVIKINKNYNFHLYKNLPSYFINKICGNQINNIYIAGAFGLLAHFNGISWWIHPDFFNGTFYSMNVKGKIAIAVGEKNHNAIITKLIRN